MAENIEQKVKELIELIDKEKRPVRAVEVFFDDHSKTLDPTVIVYLKHELSLRDILLYSSIENDARTVEVEEGVIKVVEIDLLIFRKDYFEDFLVLELQFLLEEKNREQNIKRIEEELSNSFNNFYRIKNPLLLKNSHFKTFLQQFGEIYPIINKYPDKFYLKKDTFYSNEKDKESVGLCLWEETAETVALKMIREELYCYLYSSSNPEIDLKKATHFINRSKTNYGVPRPILIDFVLTAVKSKNKMIEVDGDLIKIKQDYLDEIIFDLRSENTLWELSKSSFIPQGIVAIRFTGEDFPITEAKEYVKVRDIIALGRKNYEYPQTLLNYIIRNTELFQIISRHFSKKEEAIEWLTNNTRCHIIGMSFKLIETIFPMLIKKVNPVLNVKDNPDNIFYSTISKLLKIAGSESSEEQSNLGV